MSRFFSTVARVPQLHPFKFGVGLSAVKTLAVLFFYFHLLTHSLYKIAREWTGARGLSDASASTAGALGLA